MKRSLQAGIAAGIVILAVGIQGDASTLTKITNAGTYPIRKVGKNTTHNVKQPVKSVAGPINQAGQTTSRSFHKVIPR